MDKLLTVKEVAEIIGVHIDTVRIWLRTGRMKGVKFGKAWRIPESELKKATRITIKSLAGLGYSGPQNHRGSMEIIPQSSALCG
ncbi:helix-turn-helix domain-containing protein (plasmid) [Pyramidobacter sp. YE332]|uniref:helix-turn-helix domain-containing protein n=1 Tax=Pyramidobacter sp. YE332 TaxID=3068894 RepID=UPI00294AB944|nr:helix-turn-helix domain-containing protein [Pyramidobacter sp. YE332]WOL41370.1 helix-turn-helix domain-containing protein [Pyramidobacter sp. YE332]